MNKITTYINESLQELHAVRWPTRQQAVRLSGIVIAFVAASTVVFGAVDFGLAKVVTLLLSLT
jgi:preprotein translocase SecE subunit